MIFQSIEQILNLAASWALFGLIWTIQLSHYPAFKFIGESQFHDFHQHHTGSITLVVMPLMLIELALAFWFTYQYGWAWGIPLCMVLLIWASTFFIQIPLHNQLADGKNIDIIQRLITTNWLRTILWTIKAVLVSYYLFR